jgi:hypothetical protein
MKTLKTMFALGIVAGLAAVSANAQEGCDGPVLVPGYTAGSCNCVNSTSGSGSSGGSGSCQPSSGTVGYRNDYYTCGGSGYTSCSSESATVGYVNPGCVDTPNTSALVTLEDAYADCIRLNNGTYNPPITCTPPQFCDWNTCSMATSGGTPITANVVDGLGDNNGCMLAKLQKSPSKSVVELAQAILKRLGC